MTSFLLVAAAWLVLTWLAYRNEHRELVEEREIERAYADGYKLKAQVAIERERLRRFDLAALPVDRHGEN